MFYTLLLGLPLVDDAQAPPIISNNHTIVLIYISSRLLSDAQEPRLQRDIGL